MFYLMTRDNYLDVLLKTKSQPQFERPVERLSTPFFPVLQGSNRRQFSVFFPVSTVRSAEGRNAAKGADCYVFKERSCTLSALKRISKFTICSPMRQRKFCLYILVYMAVINPKSVKVNVTTGTGMDIEWDDGHRTHFAFQWLRDACPCATCTEERNNHHRNPGEPAKQSTALLPMYKEPAKPKEVKPVGRYALNIAWNDGHASGIYSWDYLREICQCEECRAKVVG
jgi:DUF971 family protein